MLIKMLNQTFRLTWTWPFWAIVLLLVPLHAYIVWLMHGDWVQTVTVLLALPNMFLAYFIGWSVRVATLSELAEARLAVINKQRVRISELELQLSDCREEIAQPKLAEET